MSSESAVSSVIFDLQRRGVSAEGAQAFLQEAVVQSPSDRYHLAQIMHQEIVNWIETGFPRLRREAARSSSSQNNGNPALQKNREAAARSQSAVNAREASVRAQVLQALGVTSFGVNQFLAGFPVVSGDDRRLLASILFAFIEIRQSRRA